MDLLLFGRQGSGKGTLGQFLTTRYNLLPFVTGDELRKLAKEDSALGQKVKSIIEAGHLVPNDVVMEIIENFMKTIPAETNVLFDGIPRKMEQAETFDALMNQLGRTFTGLLLEISEETALKRLTHRRICESCKAIYPADYAKETCDTCEGKLIVRTDDTNMDSIRNRLDAYTNETLPVIDHYRTQGKVMELSGEPSILEVEEKAEEMLKEVMS